MLIGESLKRRVVRMSGRSPGFQCEIQRYIDDDACVIVLGNNYSGTSSLIADDLAAILFGEPEEPFVLAPTMKVGEKTAAPLAGRYQGGKDFIRPGAALAVIWKDGHLGLDWGGGYVAALFPSRTEATWTGCSAAASVPSPMNGARWTGCSGAWERTTPRQESAERIAL